MKVANVAGADEAVAKPITKQEDIWKYLLHNEYGVLGGILVIRHTISTSTS